MALNESCGNKVFPNAWLMNVGLDNQLGTLTSFFYCLEANGLGSKWFGRCFGEEVGVDIEVRSQRYIVQSHGPLRS